MSKLQVDDIVNKDDTSAVGFSKGAIVTGVITATTANVTGNMTVGGELTYEDVTNVDSVGFATFRKGINVQGAGSTTTTLNVTGVSTFGGNVLIADKIIHTGDTDTAIRFPAADTFTVETGGSERLRIDSSGRLLKGKTTTTHDHPLQIVSSTNTNAIAIAGRASDDISEITFYENDDSTILGQIQHKQDHAVIRHRVGYLRFDAGGITESMRITSTGGVHFNNAELIERVNIVANKLSAVPNVNLDNGMVHYYTTNETTTANPNIITTAGINTNMATGDTMSVTILSKPNGAGYFPRISIDGRLAGITTYWSGGSAPSSAESSGVDVNVYQIIKTADETFDVLANTSNFA